MLDEFDHTKAGLSRTKLDLASEQDTRRRIQQDLAVAQKRAVCSDRAWTIRVAFLLLIPANQDRRQYVMVLIDADADAYTVRPLIPLDGAVVR